MKIPEPNSFHLRLVALWAAGAGLITLNFITGPEWDGYLIFLSLGFASIAWSVGCSVNANLAGNIRWQTSLLETPVFGLITPRTGGSM